MRCGFLLVIVVVGGCGSFAPSAEQIAAAKHAKELGTAEDAFRNAAGSFLDAATIMSDKVDVTFSPQQLFEDAERLRNEIKQMPDARHNKQLNAAFDTMQRIARLLDEIGQFMIASKPLAIDNAKSSVRSAKLKEGFSLLRDDIKLARQLIAIPAQTEQP